MPVLQSFPENNWSHGGRPWFQHDNAKPHTAKITKQFLIDKNIRVMDWPPQSPDLNLIENLWHIIKHRIRKSTRKPKSLSDLERHVNNCWNNDDIILEYCQRLIKSMLRRVAACIAAGGGPTKY